jgi:4-diphosphocytidyl-2-C-methyl-D-erythritol kinase
VISPAPGKINVCLYVGGTREDGRHEVVSILQSVGLADRVELTAASTDALICPGVDGPNIVSAAIDAFRVAAGDEQPYEVRIDKRIPVAAGMAGGSADAGAVLRMLNASAGGPLNDGAMHEIAASLGADVPAQLLPGRALAIGAGEIVEQLPNPPESGIVVLPHHKPLATPAVFAEFDRLGLARGAGELAELLDAVRWAVARFPDHLVVNDLQPAAISLCGAVGDNLERMRAAGARIALVSGSGPTVLGLCDSLADAERVAAELGPPALAVAPWTKGAVIE